MNEPHALFHYNGMWHLFYQYNPVGPYWRNIRWGHWVSEDMVTWQSVRDAVGSDGRERRSRRHLDGATSCSTGRGDPFSSSRRGTIPARTTTPTRTSHLRWRRIIPIPVSPSGRSAITPSCRRRRWARRGNSATRRRSGIGNERYMVVGGASDGRGTAHVFKTTSDALTDWQYMGQLFTPSVYKSEYGTVWEMPNLVPLPYEDGRQSGKYLFVFSPQHGDNDVWYLYGHLRRADLPLRSRFCGGEAHGFRGQRVHGPNGIHRSAERGGYISAPSCRTSARTKSIISRAGRTHGGIPARTVPARRRHSGAQTHRHVAHRGGSSCLLFGADRGAGKRTACVGAGQSAQSGLYADGRLRLRILSEKKGG